MPPELQVVGLALALPFLATAATPLLYRLLGERTGYAGAAVALASFGLIGSQAGAHGTVSVPWIPSMDVAVRFQVDGLSLLFALLASGVGALVFVYSVGYMHGEEHLPRYYAALLAFMGSILGVALSANLLVLFLFWELTSVCSYVLIGHHSEDPDSIDSARMAMLVTVGGGLCLLIGILLLAVAAESALGVATFDLSAMLARPDAMLAALDSQGLLLPVLGLFAVAAGAKSAQVPLHFWLPGAMVAPTPVSAFLHSATMVKVGVYFLGRIRPLLVGVEWTAVFATVGMVTMLVGAALAVMVTDSKRLLAYSTASHLGLMVAAFGFGSPFGAEAGAFHLFNHALFKAALFLVAGIVAHRAGTRHMPDVGGLWRDLPVTAAIAGVASLSMAGIPPFNGFYSKELLFEAAWTAGHEGGGLAYLYPAVAVAASVLTVVYSLRFLWMFLGEQSGPARGIDRPSVLTVGPPAVLAVVAAVVGLAPGLAVDAIVQSAVDATAVGKAAVHAGIPTSLSPPVVMSLISILGGLVAFPAYGRLAGAIGSVVRGPVPLRPSGWYAGLVAGTERTGAWLGPRVHDGRLRTYLTWVVLAASGLALAGYAAGGPAVGLGEPGVSLAVGVVLVVAVVAGGAVVAAVSHVAGVLSLSILGFMIAIFYILASAPDLALTQLVVETLVLLIFLLVVEELPAVYGDLRARVAVRDGVVAFVVGATAFLTVLATMPGEGAAPTELARYYATRAVPEGGGTNIVNVILVDFRGFDTLGELLVVAIAAIAVLVLVTMRTRGETR